MPEQTRIVHHRAKNVIAGRSVRTQYRGGEYRIQVRLGNELSGLIVEARSNSTPGTDSVLMHIAPESIHFIPEIPVAASCDAIEDSPVFHDLRILSEEIA